MPALASLKISRPSLYHLRQIQRLRSDRHFSNPAPSPTTAPPPLPLIGGGHQHDPDRGSFIRWLSGIAAGSTLGLAYWSATTSEKPLFTFADWSTPSNDTESSSSSSTDRPFASAFRKLALPDHRSKFLFGDEYRRKVFFKYEKRIRLRSPPEKVFEYFASIRAPDGELLMRPADLMRAVVPVFPPSESNLVRDGYLRGERSPGELRCEPSEFFMLFDVNNDGLISFKEYIFFVTLLSIPESSFSVAFKMFDINNNGEIDKEEFKKVMALMRAHNRQGAVHRDGHRTGLKVHGSVENGGLVASFFGGDGKSYLQYDKFVQFLKNLHDEILRLEFAHYDYKLRGSISAKDFALSIVASADMSHLDRLLDRVDELNKKEQLKDLRITFEEFKNFSELRKKLLPFSLALFSYGEVNGLLSREDFQRAASHVCGISLTDNIVDIIFHVFDTNCDGNLSTEEFLRVLHKRERDIAQPTESGILGFFPCCFNCSNNRFIDRLFS